MTSGWLRRRITTSIIVLFAAIVINFIIPRLMPGDVTDSFISTNYDESTRLATLKRVGLDQPVLTQFWLYLKNIFTGNFGISFFRFPRSVASMIAEALPKSLALLLISQFFSTILGYFLGVEAGWKAGSKKDSTITGLTMLIWAAPMFWVAMIVLYVGAFYLDWFPLSGYYTIGAEYANVFEKIGDLAHHAFLPILTLVITRFGAAQLVMRNTITITVKENYITSARAKGLSDRRVKHRHAARNALLPLVTSTSFGIALAVSGQVFIEKIFSYPGIGQMIFDSVVRRDYPVLQGSFLISTIMVIGVIFVLDLIYARLDPRVRY